jgi:hypothetical protein
MTRSQERRAPTRVHRYAHPPHPPEHPAAAHHGIRRTRNRSHPVGTPRRRRCRCQHRESPTFHPGACHPLLPHPKRRRRACQSCKRSPWRVRAPECALRPADAERRGVSAPPQQVTGSLASLSSTSSRIPRTAQTCSPPHPIRTTPPEIRLPAGVRARCSRHKMRADLFYFYFSVSRDEFTEKQRRRVPPTLHVHRDPDHRRPPPEIEAPPRARDHPSAPSAQESRPCRSCRTAGSRATGAVEVRAVQREQRGAGCVWWWFGVSSGGGGGGGGSAGGGRARS